MGGITAGAVEDYIYSLLPPRDEVLTEIEAEAAKRKIPIVGPAVGRILYQLALMINARSVFELGSAVGYSTIWWARAVGEGGRVIYTDGDRKNADEAADISIAPESPSKSPSRPVTPSSFSPKKNSSSTSFSMTSIKKTILASSSWSCTAAHRRPVRYRQCFVEWEGSAGQSIRGFDQGDPGVQPLLYGSAELFTTILPIRDGVAVAIKK
jgi:hypothetical protein